VRRLLFRKSIARESRDEMAFHVETSVAELMRQGVPESDARRRVRLEIGDVDVEVERLSDQRPGASLERLLRDVRMAARRLSRAPTFVAVTVVLVAIGVGASTSIFTLVDRVLLRPLPLPQPQRLVRLYESSPERGIGRTDVARGNLAEWRGRSRSFEGLAVAYTMGRTLSEGDRAEVASVAQVTCDYLTVVGVPPLMGSGFTPDQCRAARFSNAAAPIGSDPVVILTQRYWQRRFGGDPEVVGRVVQLDRQPFRVIGVLPDEAGVVIPGADALIAWELDESLPNDQRYAVAFGRLRADATLATARSELTRVAADLARERPQTNRDWTVDVVPMHDDAVRGTSTVLVALLVAAGLLLLIACANVALLLSARGLARAHEASLHLALGGSPWLVLRGALLESAGIAGAGGALGAALAFATVGAIRRAWVDLPRADEVVPDGTALGFALGATVVAALLAGLIPALRQARRDPIDALRGGRRATSGRSARRFHDALVVAEVAFTIVLLSGAGLLVRSVAVLRGQHPGYDARDVTVLPIFLDAERYRSGAATRAYYDDLFTRLRALPGVVAVGGATTLPTSDFGPDFARPVWPVARAGDERAVRSASVRIVTPGYFDALRIPLVSGRGFDDRDGPNGRPVIAVSERLARALWPAKSPIGEYLVVDYSTAGTSAYEVVGVVADLRFRGPRTEPLEEVYFPHAQRSYLILNVAVRGSPGLAPSPATIAATLRAIDAQKPPQGVYRLDALLENTFRRERWAMELLVGFAGTAALLSALGIYGMIAYRVRQEWREIGVRLALGSSPAAVVRWIARDVGGVLVRGALVGLVSAAIGARFIRTLLYSVAPYDPWTGGSVLVVMALVAGVAACLPAYRAARVAPASALRVD
jgi:predicted permease